MRILNILFSIVAILFAFQEVVSAETFRVLANEWVWFSPNLEKTNHSIEATTNNAIEQQDFHLGNATYDKYFERNGQPPDYSFLQILNKDIQGARIEGNDIVFLKTGIRLPLKTDIFPSGADQALPYLMEIPNTKMVIAVYPYYFYGCKDNEHIVELYSEDGFLLYQFDSLPTHTFRGNPELLISPERSGCCDALKWSLHFYDLKKGNVSNYGCPEGACGDMLFVKIEQDGFFLVGIELIGSFSGVGAFLQTNIFIINDDGVPIASGKIIHALRSSSIHKRNIQKISPFSISKLSSLVPISENGSNRWLLEFRNKNKTNSFVMNGKNESATPAVVFLIPKETGRREIVEFNNREIGYLPTIVICESGNYIISGNMSKMMSGIKVLSDTVNKKIF